MRSTGNNRETEDETGHAIARHTTGCTPPKPAVRSLQTRLLAISLICSMSFFLGIAVGPTLRLQLWEMQLLHSRQLFIRLRAADRLWRTERGFLRLCEVAHSREHPEARRNAILTMSQNGRPWETLSLVYSSAEMTGGVEGELELRDAILAMDYSEHHRHFLMQLQAVASHHPSGEVRSATEDVLAAFTQARQRLGVGPP